MAAIVSLAQFCVLTNLTLMGIEADVGTPESLPHGLSWGGQLDLEAAGGKNKASLLCRLWYGLQNLAVDIYVSAS